MPEAFESPTLLAQHQRLFCPAGIFQHRPRKGFRWLLRTPTARSSRPSPLWARTVACGGRDVPAPGHPGCVDETPLSPGVNAGCGCPNPAARAVPRDPARGVCSRALRCAGCRVGQMHPRARAVCAGLFVCLPPWSAWSRHPSRTRTGLGWRTRLFGFTASLIFG